MEDNLYFFPLTEFGDFKIGGRIIINKVRFANDTAIIAKNQEENYKIWQKYLQGSMAWKSTSTNHNNESIQESLIIAD